MDLLCKSESEDSIRLAAIAGPGYRSDQGCRCTVLLYSPPPPSVICQSEVNVNLAGLPALVLPCGFVDEGPSSLPVGLHIVGAAFDEILPRDLQVNLLNQPKRDQLLEVGGDRAHTTLNFCDRVHEKLHNAETLIGASFGTLFGPALCLGIISRRKVHYEAIKYEKERNAGFLSPFGYSGATIAAAVEAVCSMEWYWLMSLKSQISDDGPYSIRIWRWNGHLIQAPRAYKANQKQHDATFCMSKTCKRVLEVILLFSFAHENVLDVIEPFIFHFLI